MILKRHTFTLLRLILDHGASNLLLRCVALIVLFPTDKGKVDEQEQALAPRLGIETSSGLPIAC